MPKSPASATVEVPVEVPVEARVEAAVEVSAETPVGSRRTPVPVGRPRAKAALARETRPAASEGRQGAAEEAGGEGWPGKTDGTNAARSVLDTRADMRRPSEAAEARPAGSPLARRSLRRSRTAS
jgi:hypothetical protein